MDGAAVLEQVREAKRTELDRLGSDKALLASTDAVLERGPVLSTVASAERTLQATLGEWAGVVDDDAIADAFEGAAAAAGEHADRLARDLDGPLSGTAWLGPALDDLDTPMARLGGGLLGQSLVLDRTLLQVVNFFVNEADEPRAELARDVRAGVGDRLESGTSVLTTVAVAGADVTAARSGAESVIDAAYADYVTTLEEMGLDPKPVC